MELRGDLEVYADAFVELHRARSCGNGPTGLTVSDVGAWLELSGVAEPWEREEFLRMVQVLDSEWLTWARKETERAHPGPGDRRAQSPHRR